MYVMVLNDGETWTELEGCKIVNQTTLLNARCAKDVGKGLDFAKQHFEHNIVANKL